MTLKGDNDFKLSEFVAGAPEFFEPFYGVGGVDGDGDVTKTENLKEFQNFVREQTNGRGVHFLMADGVNFVNNFTGILILSFVFFFQRDFRSRVKRIFKRFCRSSCICANFFALYLYSGMVCL